MKKINLFFIIFLLAGLSACKDKEPVQNHGSVRLDPSTVTLTCGETVSITPYFSKDGLAQSKKYSWKNENEDIISHNLVHGSKMEVTAKRVGEANITIYAVDGTISAKSKIIVNPTMNFLPFFIYFKSGESKKDVEFEASGVKNTSQSTKTLSVYDINSAPILQQIYHFDENEKLISTLIVLENTEENLKNAKLFIEERYKNLNITTTEYINYYDASISPRYEAGTIVGIFLPSSTPIPKYAEGKLGIKYTTMRL